MTSTYILFAYYTTGKEFSSTKVDNMEIILNERRAVTLNDASD